MKKALIAGAASLAVAAMPVVGVFAVTETTLTDKLEVTVSKSCSMAVVTHTPGTVADGGAASEWATDTLKGTFAVNTYTNNFGSTEFNVKCNNNNGWEVTIGAAENLTSGANTIPFAGAAFSDASASGYNLTSTGKVGGTTAGYIATNDATVAEGQANDVATGESFVVTYGVAVATSQNTGTYTGNVVYTLASLQ